MKRILILTILLVSAQLTGCSSEEDSSPSITANIDGKDYIFGSCARVSGLYSYSVGCHNISNGVAMRLQLTVGLVNSSPVSVRLTDIPDVSQLDSPYGIDYECLDTGVPVACASGIPVFDINAITITLTDVVVNLYNNNTDYNGGPLVTGVPSHTISLTANMAPYALQ